MVAPSSHDDLGHQGCRVLLGLVEVKEPEQGPRFDAAPSVSDLDGRDRKPGQDPGSDEALFRGDPRVLRAYPEALPPDLACKRLMGLAHAPDDTCGCLCKGSLQEVRSRVEIALQEFTRVEGRSLRE
jgi:hypothetical protein